MMYAVLCVYVFVFMFNEYVWFVCALLCDVVWPVLLCFVCVLCVCVLLFVYMRLGLLFVLFCVVLYGWFVLVLFVCVCSLNVLVRRVCVLFV